MDPFTPIVLTKHKSDTAHNTAAGLLLEWMGPESWPWTGDSTAEIRAGTNGKGLTQKHYCQSPDQLATGNFLKLAPPLPLAPPRSASLVVL